MNPYRFIINYLTSRGTILSLIGDIIIFSGVVFLNWNAARAIGFICLDVYVMVIFYLLFMKIEENFSGTIWKIVGVFLFTSLMLGYFFTVIQVSDYFLQSRDTKLLLADVGRLLYPYYDVGIFLTLAASAHLHTVFKLRKAPDSDAKITFEIKAVVYRMLMIPATLLVGGFISFFFKLNAYTVPMVGFLVVKEILEYWKFKALTQLHVIPVAQQTIAES